MADRSIVRCSFQASFEDISGGNVLPLLTAASLALLAEIYTTTAGTSTGQTKAEQARRVRLRYKSSAIADFGICASSAKVTASDRLAYVHEMPNTPIIKGQDHNDHYWLYFTTAAGEDVTLDCSVFTFNMCTVIPTDAYSPHYDSDLHMVSPFAPAWYPERTHDKYNTNLYVERKRVSVLRDPHTPPIINPRLLRKSEQNEIQSLINDASRTHRNALKI